MLANRSIPACTVIPELPYPDLGTAIEWLSKTFGFALRIRIGDHRAQMNVGDGAVVLTEWQGDEDSLPPPNSVLVRVEDAQRHYERILENGARVLRPPCDYPFGERQYTVLDLAGHRWTFSQSIADIDPKEWGGTLPT